MKRVIVAITCFIAIYLILCFIEWSFYSDRTNRIGLIFVGTITSILIDTAFFENKKK